MPADPHKIFSRDKDNLKFLWNQSLIKLKSWFPHYTLHDSRICSDVSYKNSKENCGDYILYIFLYPNISDRKWYEEICSFNAI